MELHPTPEQEAIIRAAIEAGRYATPEDVLREALALWECREQAADLAEFKTTLDEAEASLDRGEGQTFTADTASELVDDVMARCRAKLKAR